MGRGLHALPVADGSDWYNEGGGDSTCFLGFCGMRMEREQLPFPSVFSLFEKENCGPLVRSGQLFAHWLVSG